MLIFCCELIVPCGASVNSRAEAPELTFKNCPALPIESELFQIPPEPEASTFQYVPLVGTFPVVGLLQHTNYHCNKQCRLIHRLSSCRKLL